MSKNGRIALISSIALLVLVLIACIRFFVFGNQNDEPKIVIKDNVKVITYVTKRAKEHKITCPEFTFEYSNNWKIKQEDLQTDYEWDVLENERGVTINYYESNQGFGSQYYGGGFTLRYAKVEKIAESAFHPGYVQAEDYSSLGKFVVAKVTEYAQEDGLNGGGRQPVDGSTFYAVIPESYLGETQFKGMGYWAALSWKYPQPIAFLALSPDGKFTAQEETEIVYTLSTFKET